MHAKCMNYALIHGRLINFIPDKLFLEAASAISTMDRGRVEKRKKDQILTNDELIKIDEYN